ncbi:MAG TPA: hypothetical protein VJ969_07420, partial [Desulfopila sp.]|nr:hypothetical protein [Desulfopila sp.]
MNSADTSDKTVAESENRDDIASLSLVLSAIDISHSVVNRENRYLLCVAEEDRQRALHNIERYHQENTNWPPPAIVTEEAASSLHPPTLLVIGGLMLFYFV